MKRRIVISSLVVLLVMVLIGSFGLAMDKKPAQEQAVVEKAQAKVQSEVKKTSEVAKAEKESAKVEATEQKGMRAEREAEVRMEKADELRTQREYQRAIAEYQSIIELYPNTGAAQAALMKIGYIYVSLGNSEKAFEAFKKRFSGIVDRPTDAALTQKSSEVDIKAQFYVAKGYYLERKYRQAIEEYNKLIKEYPKSEYAQQAKEQIPKLQKLAEKEEVYEAEAEKIKNLLSKWEKGYETEDINLIKECLSTSSPIYSSFDTPEVREFFKKYDVQIKINEMEIQIKDDKAEVTIYGTFETNPPDKSEYGQNIFILIRENGKWKIYSQ